MPTRTVDVVILTEHVLLHLLLLYCVVEIADVCHRFKTSSEVMQITSS